MEKKIWYIVVPVIIIICFVALRTANGGLDGALFGFAEGGERVLYSGGLSSNAEMTECADSSVAARLKTLSGGESVSFQGGINEVREIVETLRAVVKFTERIDGVYSVYAYSDGIYGYKTVRGMRINLHIALSNGIVTVGTPMIFGSY